MTLSRPEAAVRLVRQLTFPKPSAWVSNGREVPRAPAPHRVHFANTRAYLSAPLRKPVETFARCAPSDQKSTMTRSLPGTTFFKCPCEVYGWHSESDKRLSVRRFRYSKTGIRLANASKIRTPRRPSSQSRYTPLTTVSRPSCNFTSLDQARKRRPSMSKNTFAAMQGV